MLASPLPRHLKHPVPTALRLPGTKQTLPHCVLNGYVVPFAFLNLLLFCYCFGASADLVPDSLNVPPWLPLTLRRPLFERMAPLFVKTRCCFLEIKCKTQKTKEKKQKP